MFNFLKTTRQRANSASKPVMDTKQSSGQTNQDSISQKLDKTAKLLDKKTNKNDLIKHALEVQKSQSRLLDNLDETTKKRMKAIALQLMIFQKRN